MLSHTYPLLSIEHFSIQRITYQTKNPSEYVLLLMSSAKLLLMDSLYEKSRLTTTNSP